MTAEKRPKPPLTDAELEQLVHEQMATDASREFVRLLEQAGQSHEDAVKRVRDHARTLIRLSWETRRGEEMLGEEPDP